MSGVLVGLTHGSIYLLSDLHLGVTGNYWLTLNSMLNSYSLGFNLI